MKYLTAAKYMTPDQIHSLLYLSIQFWLKASIENGDSLFEDNSYSLRYEEYLNKTTEQTYESKKRDLEVAIE